MLKRMNENWLWGKTKINPNKIIVTGWFWISDGIKRRKYKYVKKS